MPQSPTESAPIRLEIKPIQWSEVDPHYLSDLQDWLDKRQKANIKIIPVASIEIEKIDKNFKDALRVLHTNTAILDISNGFCTFYSNKLNIQALRDKA